MHDRFSFTGHQSLNYPISPQSGGVYLSWRTPQTKPAHCELSRPPVAVEFGDVVCKTLKALLGRDQKKEPAELPGVGWGACMPSPACKPFQMAMEEGSCSMRRPLQHPSHLGMDTQKT